MSLANQAHHDAWNGDSGHRWAADAERRDEVLAPVADALFTAVELRLGEAVLDLGCGCGVTTIAAADAVAPGDVVGIDLSAPMLALARARGGDRDVTFVQADAQTHRFGPARFDVAISRFGTMFFDDPVAAFANVGSALRSGARLCLSTWQPLEANDWLLVPGAALLRYGQLPATATGSGPGMFAQSSPDIVERVLTAAGWTAVHVQPTTVTLRLGGDAHEATEYLASTGIARAVLDTIPGERREEAIEAVTDALARHQSTDGVMLAAGIHLVTADRGTVASGW
jgi:ubiquinone/menaquinone biosynthesis C-methylase UbiE